MSTADMSHPASEFVTLNSPRMDGMSGGSIWKLKANETKASRVTDNMTHLYRGDLPVGALFTPFDVCG